MGTRQEVGILLLILMLALPAMVGGRRGQDHEVGPATPKQMPERVCDLTEPGSNGTRCVLQGSRIPLNLATPGDLEVIPGVGPVLAGRIVATRHRLGMFEDLEELYQVKGIGPKRLEVIRSYVVVEAVLRPNPPVGYTIEFFSK